MQQQTIPAVLVFKTNIALREQVSKVAALLNENAAVKKWTIDLGDIDRVLRIETDQLQPEDVIALVGKAGFWCEELPD
jgi:hypothetical protein